MNKTLLVYPIVGAWKLDDDLYFDRKFYDGMISYKKTWSSNIKVLMYLDSHPPPLFGLIKYNEVECPFQLVLIDANVRITASDLKGADIVLSSADDFMQFHVAAVCKSLSIKCVFVIEYTLKTRIQIVMLDSVSIWQKFKTVIWLVLQEVKLKKAMRLATSVQANGVPAYNKYAVLAPNPLLYFDTRNTAAMLIKQQELQSRLDYLDLQKPIRLGFSGRLIEIKGANDLIELAHMLNKIGLIFSLDIFGGGDQSNQMLKRVNELDLKNVVKLHGPVDYETVLVPFLKTSVDVFICCHKQGDPSCTYLETYSCGVPIVGYANEAHAGILTKEDVGWQVPIGNIKEMSGLIVMLDKNREQVKTKAKAAINFAKIHTFETTFEARMKHVIDVVNW